MPSGAICAGILAGCLAICELLNATRKPPAIRATGWILVLFCFDGGSSLLIFALLKELFQGLSWFTGFWPILISGLSGPALLRSQLALLGSGQESSYYGPATRYRRIQQGIERRIDQLGADAQSDWVASRLSFVLDIAIDDFSLRVTTFVKSLGNSFGADERENLLRYVEETLTDSHLDDSTKRRAIVQKLIDTGCRQCVKGLVRRGKRLRKHPGQPSGPLASKPPGQLANGKPSDQSDLCTVSGHRTT
jgi:hypothetical protein